MKKIPYQYIEVDPYQKPQSLLDVNPRGLVPALRHDDWGCYESTVLMEYVREAHHMLGLGPSISLILIEPLLLARGLETWQSTSTRRCKDACPLPTLGRPCEQALMSRFMAIADKSMQINRNIVPNFYRVLQEQDPEKQVENAKELQSAFDKLLAAAHPDGPFFMGSQMSFVDVQAAPWVIRIRRVLTPYRGWPDAEAGTRWASWVDAIDANEHVRATTSSDELYLDSYARYAGKSFGRDPCREEY